MHAESNVLDGCIGKKTIDLLEAIFNDNTFIYIHIHL